MHGHATALRSIAMNIYDPHVKIKTAGIYALHTITPRCDVTVYVLVRSSQLIFVVQGN